MNRSWPRAPRLRESWLEVAGITRTGTAIRQARDANEAFYGHPYRTREIVFDGKGIASAPVRAFTNLLEQHAG